MVSSTKNYYTCKKPSISQTQLYKLPEMPTAQK